MALLAYVPRSCVVDGRRGTVPGPAERQRDNSALRAQREYRFGAQTCFGARPRDLRPGLRGLEEQRGDSATRVVRRRRASTNCTLYMQTATRQSYCRAGRVCMRRSLKVRAAGGIASHHLPESHVPSPCRRVALWPRRLISVRAAAPLCIMQRLSQSNGPHVVALSALSSSLTSSASSVFVTHAKSPPGGTRTSPDT